MEDLQETVMTELFDRDARQFWSDTASSTANNTDRDGEDSDSLSLGEGEGMVLLSGYDEGATSSFMDVQVTFEKHFFDQLKERGEYVSAYGCPLSPEEASERMPAGDDGLVWRATIIPNDFFVDGKLLGGLNKGDYDHENQCIKPRRPSLPVTVTDFFSSLTKIDGKKGPRWIFSGVLNGWPQLTCLELVRFERKRQSSSFGPKDILTGQMKWARHWNVDEEGRNGVAPTLAKDETGIYRAKLRGAPWTSKGWSKDAPGFVFWYESLHPKGPRLSYGTNMVKTVGEDKCTAVHMISHRYAVKRETPKDKFTYHSIVLLEWEHGKYCTVVEGAYLNGIGGYKGKCNWYHDMKEPVTELYRSLPPEMIGPWLSSRTEIRCYDVDVRNLEEMKAYIAQYVDGDDVRFVEPHYTFSHRARLSYRSKSQIAQYLLNYIGRDCSYSELKRNCQTFAADFCSFLAGKKGVEPFHPVNRIEYRNRTHYFMYDSAMYETAKVKRNSF